MSQPLLVPFLIAALGLTACRSSSPTNESAWPTGVSLPDVALSVAPFETVHVNWKQRLREPYIYLNHRGDYRQAGARIAELLAAAQDQDAPVQGAPFVLFYDDPAATATDQLEARICIAIDDAFSARLPLLMDDLPAENVVYAAVAGAFPEVPRAYPGIFAYMAKRGWQPRTPIREVYLVSPVDHALSELVTEVQIPWVPGG